MEAVTANAELCVVVVGKRVGKSGFGQGLMKRGVEDRNVSRVGETFSSGANSNETQRIVERC